MSKKQYIVLIALAVVLILGGVAYGSYYFWQKQTQKNGIGILCTGEVKTCTDGSSVHRVVPNCKFAKCPAEILKPAGDINQKTCQIDSDCACGTKIDTGECFFGNKKYVNVLKQCPDYCSGFTGHLIISCVDGLCRQVEN